MLQTASTPCPHMQPLLGSTRVRPKFLLMRPDRTRRHPLASMQAADGKKAIPEIPERLAFDDSQTHPIQFLARIFPITEIHHPMAKRNQPVCHSGPNRESQPRFPRLRPASTTTAQRPHAVLSPNTSAHPLSHHLDARSRTKSLSLPARCQSPQRFPQAPDPSPAPEETAHNSAEVSD